MLRAVVPILCILTLSGCSYSYDVQARVSDGRLVFDANPQWGDDCVRHVEVESEENVAGAVWEQALSLDDGCENTFPIPMVCRFVAVPTFTTAAFPMRWSALQHLRSLPKDCGPESSTPCQRRVERLAMATGAFGCGPTGE